MIRSHCCEAQVFRPSLKKLTVDPLAPCFGVLGTMEPKMRPKRTILCVDDNEQALSIRKVMLETRGYRVLACTTGNQALELFRQGGIHLVLSDLQLPALHRPPLLHKPKDLSPQPPPSL